VPAGIQSGQRLRLRERGVPSRRTGVRGDLVLDVVLVLPPVIDARARGLMQEFARLHPEDVRAAWYGEPQGAARGDDATVAPEHSPVAGRPTQAE
jgi:molecular chaperone DnaJ